MKMASRECTMDDINQTLLRVAERNKKIRSNLGAEFDEEEQRGAESVKKTVSNVTRLSYGTWAGQNFLSSTHLYTSMAEFEMDKPAPQNPTKKKKKLKKKIKQLAAISSTSDEDDVGDIASKPKASTSKKTKPKNTKPEESTSRTTLGQITENVQFPLVNRGRAMVDQPDKAPKSDIHRKSLPQNKGDSATKLPKKTTKKTLVSKDAVGRNEDSQESRSIVSKQNPKKPTSTKKKVLKKKTVKTKPKMPIPIDIDITSESEGEIERNKEALDKLDKELKARSLFRSRSSTSDKSSVTETSFPNRIREASSVNIKNFVMDLDEDSDESKGDGAGFLPCTPDEQKVVPASEESIDEAYVTVPYSQDGEQSPLQHHHSRVPPQKQNNPRSLFCHLNNESMNEKENDDYEILAPNTETQHEEEESHGMEEETDEIPCTQKAARSLFQLSDDESLHTDKKDDYDDYEILAPNTETQHEEEESHVMEEDTDEIPCTQKAARSMFQISDDESHNAETKDDYEVLASNSESIAGEESVMVQEGDIIPCTQDVPSTPIHDGVITVENTPGLIRQLVNVVNEAASDTSDVVIPDSQIASQKSSTSKVKNKIVSSTKKKGKNTKPKYQNLFETFQFTSEEEEDEGKEMNLPTVLASDSAMSSESSCLSQTNDPQLQTLSQRLKDILQKTGEKKLRKQKKGSKNGKNGRKRWPSSSTSGESRMSEISVVEDSQNLPQILASDSEPAEKDISVRSDLTEIPDSLASNLDLQMSVSASSPPLSLTPSIENTVRHVPQKSSTNTPVPESGKLNIKPGSTKYRERNTHPSGSDEFSPIIPVYAQQNNMEEEDKSPQKVNMSLQVSLSPQMEEGEEEEEEDEREWDERKMKEMSIQVSMMDIDGYSEDEEGEGKRWTSPISNGDSRNESFFTPPENKSVNITLDNGSSISGASPAMVSFSTQVSMHSSQENREEVGKVGVSFDGLNNSEKSLEMSLPVGNLVRNLAEELGAECSQENVMCEYDDEEEEREGLEEEGEESGDETYKIQAGVGRNMSLQVSMCVDPVMEDSDEEEDEEQGREVTSEPSKRQAGLQVSLQESDTDEFQPPSRKPKPTPRILDSDSDLEILDSEEDFIPSTKKLRNVSKIFTNPPNSSKKTPSKNSRKILDSDSDDYDIVDDSDNDPDFVVSPKKSRNPTKTSTSSSKNITKTSTSSSKNVTKTQASSSKDKPKRKPRSRGSAKSDSSENYSEAQAVKTVLLCEKKESVAGYGPETEDDDYELPDLEPPRLTTTRHRSDSEDDELPDIEPRITIAQNQRPTDESSDDDLDAYFTEMRNKKKENERKRQEAASRDMDDFVVDDDDVTSGEDDSPGFYPRTSRKVEKTRTNRIRSDGSDSVFKTPGRTLAPQNFKTHKPGPSRLGGKLVSKTPAPGRTYTLTRDDDHLRSHSTGHLPTYHSFLKSLSSDLDDKQRHPEAKRFVKDFKKVKEELSSKLFKMYNETVFGNALPDVKILWNSRLTTTAGYCAYKRDRTLPSGRTARVELSVKVCDSAERVRDTLIHELCHAAVWLIYGKNDGHGQYWQTLARKAMLVHPELPSISRCHVYDIHHKFIYRCSKCGQQIGRHTKSLNIEKKVCGICHGKFEVMLNTPKGLTPQASRTPRTPNKFALFVKENYNSIKQKNTGFKHQDVMKALSAEFAAKTKVS